MAVKELPIFNRLFIEYLLCARPCRYSSPVTILEIGIVQFLRYHNFQNGNGHVFEISKTFFHDTKYFLVFLIYFIWGENFRIFCTPYDIYCRNYS